MNLIKPRRTFESVVRELIAGLEEGTIVLNKDADGPKSKQHGDGSLPPDWFLNDVPTSMAEFRQDIWKLFQAAIEHARRLTHDSVEIVSVSVGCTPSWRGGRITIPVQPHDKGVIFHEVGHSFFEASRFHKDRGGGRNDWWGDAFCDAFRYCLEMQFCPGSDWLRNFPNETGGRYQYPASLILAKAPTKDFDGLLSLWTDLLAHYDASDDFLDREFDYRMPPLP